MNESSKREILWYLEKIRGAQVVIANAMGEIEGWVDEIEKEMEQSEEEES